MVMSEMNLKEVADVLDTLLANASRQRGQRVMIDLSQEEHERLCTVVSMFKLADLVNYKQAQDSFPRLLNAVKLILALDDLGKNFKDDSGQVEQISLAPKTRAQLDSAVKFAENRDRIS